MKNKGKGKSKGEGKSSLIKGHITDKKDSMWLKLLQYPDESATHIEGDTRVQLPSSKTENTNAKATEKQGEGNVNEDQELAKISLFKRRLKTSFTGNSDRHSCQLHSQGKTIRSERSGSVTASLIGSTTTRTPPPAPPYPKYLRYIRATNDYIFLDLGFLKTESLKKNIKNGSLSSMGDVKQQAPGTDKKHPKTGGLQQQIEHVRSLTRTKVKTISPTDLESPRRLDDSRQWSTVNLRCTTCHGNCPICGVACCKYAEAQQTTTNTESKSEKVERARQTLQMIEGLGNASLILGEFATGTIEYTRWEVNKLDYRRSSEKSF
ncbi:hypothetical protein BDV28DRAFT_163289 [Aspergillus coremiiformis]|uniref:Uncharacterized protein n=1 Tax=Aspergillus coremiiformis TaxID=138285 RepID=A0A5N6YWY8_9EURO|nr:hypothetical protein BDV28DRAFT_163289 [Aspergillus coremiiformis]